MSAFRGTPGPWTAERTFAPRGWNIEALDGAYTVGIARDGSSTPQNEANARLIAAAPELLQALMQLVERISYYAELKEEGIPNIEDWAYTYNSGDMQRAKAAIKKATGGAA